MLSIYDGNQENVIHGSTLSLDELKQICNKYTSEDPRLPSYIFHEYMDILFDRVIANSGKKKFTDFWLDMNKYQKVFCSLLVFTGQTDNGGVYQFIFNRPQFLVAVQESYCELPLAPLKQDYDQVLNELSGTNEINNLLEIKAIFNDDSLDFSSRWEAFVDGRGNLNSTTVIEDYFYKKKYKEEFYKSVVGYVNKNIQYFLV